MRYIPLVREAIPKSDASYVVTAKVLEATVVLAFLKPVRATVNAVVVVV